MRRTHLGRPDLSGDAVREPHRIGLGQPRHDEARNAGARGQQAGLDRVGFEAEPPDSRPRVRRLAARADDRLEVLEGSVGRGREGEEEEAERGGEEKEGSLSFFFS